MMASNKRINVNGTVYELQGIPEATIVDVFGIYPETKTIIFDDGMTKTEKTVDGKLWNDGIYKEVK